SAEVAAGYECSGNSGRSVQGLSSCGRFTGVPLSHLLKQVGVQPKAREVVFFGADRGAQEVVFRKQTFKLEQQFGRSITLENAMKPEPLLAYALNGEPLTREQGFPLRLIMPGWYGVANVKWLAEVHLQEERYLGDRKSTRLNSSHVAISYAVFCLKKKKTKKSLCCEGQKKTTKNICKSTTQYCVVINT